MSFPYRHLCRHEIVQHSWSISTPRVRRADMWVIFSSRVASPLVKKIYAHMPALLTCGVKMLHLCSTISCPHTCLYGKVPFPAPWTRELSFRLAALSAVNGCCLREPFRTLKKAPNSYPRNFCRIRGVFNVKWDYGSISQAMSYKTNLFSILESASVELQMVLKSFPSHYHRFQTMSF